MLSRQYVKLLLAAIVLVSIVLTISLSYSTESSGTGKIQQEERILENLIPNHVPLRIKIRKEKEKEFKDLNNERWARDFELQVTNTGDKPIYSFSLLLKLDVTAAAGYQIVAPISYGRIELSDHRIKAKPDDYYLAPGDSVILKFWPSQIEWWEKARQEEHRPHPKKIQVKFQNLSFGDGTGLVGDRGGAGPKKMPSQSKLKHRGPPQGWRDTLQWFGESEISKTSTKYEILPANFLPVNFLLTASGRAPSLEPLPDSCCAEGCVPMIYHLRVTCNGCPPQDDPSLTTCDDLDGDCFSVGQSHFIECGTNGCGIVEYLSCEGGPPPSPSPSPSPSPNTSPTPTPTCDPNTKPNDRNCYCDILPAQFGGTAQWYCFCYLPGDPVSVLGRPANYLTYPGTRGYAGCPPNMYNNNDD